MNKINILMRQYLIYLFPFYFTIHIFLTLLTYANVYIYKKNVNCDVNFAYINFSEAYS